MKTVASTSAAINYLPKVHKLCASIKRFHPEFEVVLALADRLTPGIDIGNEPIDAVIAVEQLDIKPFVLKALLAREDVARVIYFDPDMVLFSRLDDLLADIEGASIGLTPHQVKPERTLDAVRDNEIASLKHGIYNLGFLAVNNTAEGHRFADWWAERVYHFCVADIPNSLFTDQRWVDLAPAFFDAAKILKNPRCNAATWNLTTRLLAGNLADGYTVYGEPLGFYHFTGYDSGAHAVMANKNASGNGSVATLVNWYEEQTRFDADEPVARVPWAFQAYADGSTLPLAHRRLYRARPDRQAAFPHPFAPMLAQQCPPGLA